MVGQLIGCRHARVLGLPVSIEPPRIEHTVLVVHDPETAGLQVFQRRARKIGRVAQAVDRVERCAGLRKGRLQALDLDQWASLITAAGTAIEDRRFIAGFARACA